MGEDTYYELILASNRPAKSKLKALLTILAMCVVLFTVYGLISGLAILNIFSPLWFVMAITVISFINLMVGFAKMAWTGGKAGKISRLVFVASLGILTLSLLALLLVCF